jgi:hypothetical protein
MNRNVVAIIVIAFIVLIVFYLSIGGAFDLGFWRQALPGLMENLAIAALAAFVFDSIIRHERQAKYKDANAKVSQLVLLVTNLFAHAILKYFGLLKEPERPAEDLNFEYAYDQLKAADISGCFLRELLRLNPEEKVAYITKFADLLNTRIKPLIESLEKVYPRPDPSLTYEWDSAVGTIEGSAMLPRAFIEANAGLGEKNRLTPDQLNLLVRLGHQLTDERLKGLLAGLISLADRARNNDLFVSFD